MNISISLSIIIISLSNIFTPEVLEGKFPSSKGTFGLSSQNEATRDGGFVVPFLYYSYNGHKHTISLSLSLSIYLSFSLSLYIYIYIYIYIKHEIKPFTCASHITNNNIHL